MFSPRLLLPRSLPRTSLLSRTLSTLPPPPPPPPSAAAARPSRLRSFALTSASLVIAGYAMVASQNQATLMLEEAQGITREALSTQPSFPAQPPTTSPSKASSSIGGQPEIESTSVQSSFSSQPKEMTQEEIDDLDSGLEDEASPEASSSSSSSSSGANSAAYNEETGEINWECPCLGGMAHGPCGEQFRESFTCFVRSEEEPKGIECVESFKAMQSCFRDHPEIYGGDDIDDDDDDEANDAFEKAHPPPADLEGYGEGSGDDADLIARVEKALGEKDEGGLQEAKEGGEPLFEEKIGSETETDSQM